MKYIVYQTTNKVNNKIYIGVHKTENPDVFDGYLGCGVNIHMPSSYMKPNTPFQYAVKKYGCDSFIRTTLKVFSTLKEAFDLERQIVDHDFLNRRDTYNVALGGGGGSQKCTIIYQFDLNGNFIKKWESVNDACSFIGITHSAILRAIKEKGSCKKFFWSKESNINIKEYHAYTGSICYKYDANTGKCVDVFNSLKEAADISGERLMVVERAVKGGYQVKGYYYSTKLLEEYNGKPKVSLKKKTLYVYDLNGNFITELKNSSEICSFFNIKTTWAITTSIRLGKPYKEYQFSLEKKERLSKVINKKNIRKRVGRYTLGGDLIEEFESIEAAKKKWGSGAMRCVQGKQQQCKGYLFRQIIS